MGALLGLGKRTWDEAAQAALPGELGPVEILFNKIDETVIAAEVGKLEAAGPKSRVQSLKSEERRVIAFDEFKRLELRVARVVSAEPVPGATKLLKLVVDIGTEQRQIVAGIALSYKPEQLVGKTIVLLANLAPAKIRGADSNGMLLAASSGDRLSLLTLDTELPPGSTIS
jgi:methionyl-tRNA synthetase